jgi:nucleoside 2-deoxyribosyltransferase
MKFYVAGKYGEREHIRLVFKELQKMGHEITVDWTNHDVYPNDAIAEKLGQFAEDDCDGVRNCDALIACLLNSHEYKGLWCEMGGALILGKPVYIVGEAGDSCIFTNHRLVTKFKSFPELYDFLAHHP